jgi:hypothetical protein
VVIGTRVSFLQEGRLLALVGNLEPVLVGLVGPPLLDVVVELRTRERERE